MRLACFLVAATSCSFQGRIPPGLQCADSDRCPSGQMCFDGFCTLDPHDADPGAIDADTVTIDANTVTIDADITPQAGLVGHWRFDETSGASASDASGNSNTGTLVGNPGWTSGQINGALSFDGAKGYVFALYNAIFDVADISVSAWVYRPALQPSSSIVSRNYTLGGNNSNDLFLLFFDPLDQYAFIVRTAAGQTTLTGPSSSGDVNQWVHLVGSYDGSNMLLYRNGVLVASIAKTGSMVSETTRLTIGAEDNASGVTDFLGASVDDVRIYDRALSPNEVQALHDASAAALTPKIGL